MHSEPLSLDISADDMLQKLVLLLLLLVTFFKVFGFFLNTNFRKEIQFFVYLNSIR